MYKHLQNITSMPLLANEEKIYIYKTSCLKFLLKIKYI